MSDWVIVIVGCSAVAAWWSIAQQRETRIDREFEEDRKRQDKLTGYKDDDN